jgi:hypothetical protein
VKGSENPFPSVLLVEGDPEALDVNAAAGQRRLAVGTDHLLYLVDDAGVATEVGAGGGVTDHGALTGLGDDDHTQYVLRSILTTNGDLFTRAAGAIARLGVGSNGDVLTVASGAPSWAAPSGGSVDDPVFDQFGTPDTAFEFASSSFTGLTAMGTPDAENADTSVPDHYYVADNAGGTAWCGRYASIPSYPFTAVAKLTDFNARLNYSHAGLFLSVATPGKLSLITYGGASRNIGHALFTNPTTFGSNIGSDFLDNLTGPLYFGVVATSTSNQTWYVSKNGRVWYIRTSAHDPSMTVGSVGIGMKSENTTGAAAAFDYLRIWNSSKTFLTGA